MHQFLLGELLQTLEGEFPPSHNEVHDAFILPLFSLYQFLDTNSSLGVTKLCEELLLHRLLADNGAFQEVYIPCEGCSFQ